MKRARIMISGVVLCGAALFSLWRWDKGRERSPKPFDVPSTHEARESPAPVPSWDLTVGTEIAYQLEYHGQVDQTGLGGSLPASQVLIGKMFMGILDREDGGYRTVVWIEPEPPRDGVSEATLKALRPILKGGVEAQLSQHGFGLVLRRLDTLSEPQRAFWQSLFDRLQAPAEALLSQAPMTRNEEFGGVPIETTYIGDCGGKCSWNSSQEYHLARKITARGGSDRTVEGAAQTVFKPALQGISTLEIKTVEVIGQASSALRIHSALHVAFLTQKIVQVALWSEKMQGFRDSSRGSSAPVEQEAAIDQAVIAGLDEGQILAEVRQNQDLMELPQATYLRLKSWIALHPESLGRLSAVFVQAEGSEGALHGYIKALGAVGHVGAQDALIEIMRARPQDEDTVGRVLTGLALVKIPTESTEKALLERVLAEDSAPYRDKVKLVMGAVGHHLRQSPLPRDQERALVLEKEVARWLAVASDRAAREAALGALGNLGPTDLSVLVPLLDGSDMNMKARAYFALRFSPAPEAAQRLADGVTAQSAPSVRREALEALALRPKDQGWVDAVSSIPLANLDPGERLVLARGLSMAQSLDAKTRTALLNRLQGGVHDQQTQETVGEYLR